MDNSFSGYDERDWIPYGKEITNRFIKVRLPIHGKVSTSMGSTVMCNTL
jgi:hypothetical protein